MVMEDKSTRDRPVSPVPDIPVQHEGWLKGFFSILPDPAF